MFPIKTLLITGENNHDWQRTAPFCKKALEDSGKFEVDLTENPSNVLTDAESLTQYQLFFLDYNGADWDEEAHLNLAERIRSGAGLIVLHAANNSFVAWEEYEKMIGLSWRDGAGHGKFHEFEVQIVDKSHPIMLGLPNFRTMDELYHRLTNVQNVPVQVLATAYSDPLTGGTGQHEPMIIVLEYGLGRVYHHLLGHVWPGDPLGAHKGASMIAFENEIFQTTLLRGCEWAATGAVSG